MIHILWPTIRPQMMIDTYDRWVENHTSSSKFRTSVAVNNSAQKSKICKLNRWANSAFSSFNVYVSGDKKGVTNACHYLTHLPDLDGPDEDIVILASDDFYAPKGWDQWLVKAFTKPIEAIRVNDGYTPLDNITIPIMTLGCLKKINRVLYHTSYHHSYSDTELFYNLKHLGYLTDLWNSSPVFEHRNWANNKRPMDSIDKALRGEVLEADSNNYNIRMAMPVKERIK
ncbi:hypothetical protein N9045_02085 [bacterium]|nr:hypothetical protein [bacterium]